MRDETTEGHAGFFSATLQALLGNFRSLLPASISAASSSWDHMRSMFVESTRKLEGTGICSQPKLWLYLPSMGQVFIDSTFVRA